MVDPIYLVRLRLVLRFVQFAASLVVVVTLSSVRASMSANGYPRIDDSNDVTFVLLMNFLGLVYGLFFLVFVDILELCMRPLLYCEQVMDFLMVLLLLIASIVLTASGAFFNCRSYNNKTHCDAITVGVAFSYLSMLAFVATLTLSFFANRDYDGYDQVLFGEDSPISYEYDPTPVALFDEGSPISYEDDPNPAESPNYASSVVRV